MISLRKRLHQIFHPREELRAKRMNDAVFKSLEFAPADNNNVVPIFKTILSDTALTHGERLGRLMEVYGKLPEGNFKSSLLAVLSDAKDGMPFGHSKPRMVDFYKLNWEADRSGQLTPKV